MKKLSTYSKHSGFTLIELLVVLGIIGILAGVIYASFGEARQTARDDIRKSELRELQLALELYKAQNGEYPAACNGDAAWSGASSGSFSCVSNPYIIGLVPDFISRLPMDPNVSPNRGYIYQVRSTSGARTAYKLMANAVVEVKRVANFNDEFARCPSAIGSCASLTFPSATYSVYSAGAEGW